MKLYTEEQVMKAYNIGVEDGDCGEYRQDIESLNLTPIELPSDEEIEEGLFHQSNEYAYGYKDAFKWMRDKILNK